MCGISCYYSKKPMQESLEKSLDKISHRGPDDSSYLLYDDRRIGIGHNRLSIVDIEGGHQPLVSENGSVIIVVNGEFYGYKKIRKEFELEGYKFKTKSDSEILIPLYQKYGLNLFRHLSGDFAFALYDSEKKILLVARDRFGAKPLFYSYKNNDFFCASEIKALLEYGVEARWNLYTIIESDSFIPSQKQTYFKDVFNLKPGHFLLYDGESLQEKKYWDQEFKENKDEIDLGRSITTFSSLLKDSIEKRLIHDDLSKAFYISGGVDSAYVLSIISNKLNYNVTPFNLRFKNADYDEFDLAQKTLNHLGYSECNVVEVDEDDIADNYERAIYHAESLIHNCQGIAKFILAKAVKNSGFRVALAGDGADEILGGYPSFKEDMIRYKKPHNLDLQLSKLYESNKAISHLFLGGPEQKSKYLKPIKDKLGFIPSMFRVGVKSIDVMKDQIYTDIFISAREQENPFLNLIDSLDISELSELHPINMSMYLWSKTNFLGVILSYMGDRAEMSAPIEGRLPFLDHKLSEFCEQLPTNFKIKDTMEKYILRESAKDSIPTEIYKRQKFALTAPPIISSKGDKITKLEQLCMDLLHSKAAQEIPFYDSAKTISYVKSIKDGTLVELNNGDHILNRVVSSIILSKKFGMS